MVVLGMLPPFGVWMHACHSAGHQYFCWINRKWRIHSPCGRQYRRDMVVLGMPPPFGVWMHACQFSVSEQILRTSLKRFRGGLVFRAHRLLYHSTLGSRVKRENRSTPASHRTSKGFCEETGRGGSIGPTAGNTVEIWWS